MQLMTTTKERTFQPDNSTTISLSNNHLATNFTSDHGYPDANTRSPLWTSNSGFNDLNKGSKSTALSSAWPSHWSPAVGQRPALPKPTSGLRSGINSCLASSLLTEKSSFDRPFGLTVGNGNTQAPKLPSLTAAQQNRFQRFQLDPFVDAQALPGNENARIGSLKVNGSMETDGLFRHKWQTIPDKSPNDTRTSSDRLPNLLASDIGRRMSTLPPPNGAQSNPNDTFQWFGINSAFDRNTLVGEQEERPSKYRQTEDYSRLIHGLDRIDLADQQRGTTFDPLPKTNGHSAYVPMNHLSMSRLNSSASKTIESPVWNDRFETFSGTSSRPSTSAEGIAVHRTSAIPGSILGAQAAGHDQNALCASFIQHHLASRPSTRSGLPSHGPAANQAYPMNYGFPAASQEYYNRLASETPPREWMPKPLHQVSPRTPVDYGARYPNNIAIPQGWNLSVPNHADVGYTRLPMLDEGYGHRSMLLEEFRTNRTGRRWELCDIHQYIVEFSGDQHGSRLIQSKLENANSDEKRRIFGEIFPNALPLMKDPFANYVIQKIFEYGDQYQKGALVGCMKGQVFDLSRNLYGCRVVQKALECVLIQQQATIVQELESHVRDCVESENGNHVLQKAIEKVNFVHIQSIVMQLLRDIRWLSIHRYGCRIVQRLLEYGDTNTKAIMLEEIHQNAKLLIENQFGNYVPQHVIEYGSDQDRERMFQIIISDFVNLSKQKFASNVVEKSLKFGSDEQRLMMMHLVIKKRDEKTFEMSALQTLIPDQFGNYVVQSLLEYLSDENYRFFVLTLAPVLAAFRTSGVHSKQVENVEKKMHRFEGRHYPYGQHVNTAYALRLEPSALPTPSLSGGSLTPLSGSAQSNGETDSQRTVGAFNEEDFYRPDFRIKTDSTMLDMRFRH